MKLQDLDKTKRYDLSECTDEELLCVFEWIIHNGSKYNNSDFKQFKINSNVFVICYSNLFKYFVFGYKEGLESIKPTFIQENKQDQFLNELQQLCKKYDTTLDAYGGLGVITKAEKEIVESDLNLINSEVIDFNHKAY